MAIEIFLLSYPTYPSLALATVKLSSIYRQEGRQGTAEGARVAVASQGASERWLHQGPAAPPPPPARSTVDDTSARNSEAGISANRPCSAVRQPRAGAAAAAGDWSWSLRSNWAWPCGRGHGRQRNSRPQQQHSAGGRHARTPRCSISGTSTSASVRNRSAASHHRPATRKLHPWCRSLANCRGRRGQGEGHVVVWWRRQA